MLLLLFVASSAAFLVPLPARERLLLSASPRLPNTTAAAVPARRVRAARTQTCMSSAPIGTELVDYLFFIPFALILFALGAGARSVLMGGDGLFSQATCDPFDPNSDTGPEPSPDSNANPNPNLAQMNEEPDSIKSKIREARSSTGPACSIRLTLTLTLTLTRTLTRAHGSEQARSTSGPAFSIRLPELRLPDLDFVEVYDQPPPPPPSSSRPKSADPPLALTLALTLALGQTLTLTRRRAAARCGGDAWAAA